MTHLNRRALLAALAALACPWAARAAPLFQLGREAPPDIDPQGYLVSEKLDGVRALWDGQRMQTRGGLLVSAPAWFTRGWPQTPLDGELWIGPGLFDALSGTVRSGRVDDTEWRKVRYMLFDLPGAAGPFLARARRLRELTQRVSLPWLAALPQDTLPDAAALQARLKSVVAAGGEGLMLHRADALWQAGRTDALLKLKPHQDAEAMVLASIPGRGRLEGLMGALQLQTPDGRRFLVGSGFSDEQRREPPPAGTVITYRYRGLTSGGLPRFATFHRVRTLQ